MRRISSFMKGPRPRKGARIVEEYGLREADRK